MSKTLTFTVKVTFEDELVSDGLITEVAENIAEAIVDGAEGRGIAPLIGGDEESTYTKSVEVTTHFDSGNPNKTIKRKIC